MKRPYRKRGDPPTLTCPYCKTGFTPLLKLYRGKSGGWNYDQKYCSTACANKFRATERGSIDRHGYRILTRARNYPQVYEHRVEMERMIGRELLAHETVHHKNGVRDDNRHENLELWSGRHGRGQRASDLIATQAGDRVIAALSLGG